MIRVILNFESPLYISISALSSTHPCGVRLLMSKSASLPNGFNPRTRVGCDVRLTISRRFRRFQSTHPCGVRHYHPRLQSDLFLFQSTHPCGVRLKADANVFTINYVSIHAPVWGATLRYQAAISANRFNPRTRVGCDTVAFVT